MKIKNKINLKSKIEKKDSSMLNIFDTYAEKIDIFRLNFNQNMILSIIIIDIEILYI